MISHFFFFKQKTAYEMRISDWSSDVCSSDLLNILGQNANRSIMLPDIFHVETKLSGSLTRKPHRISSAGLIRRLHSLIYNAACSEQRSTPCTCQVLPLDAPNGPSRAFAQGLKCPAPNRGIDRKSTRLNSSH